MKFIANFRFYALFLVGCFALLLGMTRGAFASTCIDVARPYNYSCDAGQFLECGIDPYDGNCSDCVCCFCEAGYTSAGGGRIEYCDLVNPSIPSGDSGCRPIGGLCSGYDANCPASVGAGKKCKEVSGCPSPCQRYDVCDTSDGTVQHNFIDGLCHIESDTCYANERDCKDFPVAGGSMSQLPTGTAYWMGTEWNVSGCLYNVSDVDMSSAKCKKYNLRAVVTSAHSNVASASSPVTYTLAQAFCNKCYAGYLPYIDPSPNDGVITHPTGVTSNWGVTKCSIQVSAPYYADGCVVDWSAASGPDAVNDPNCKRSCPAGMETTEPGAISASDCELDSTQHFTDNTGTFTLGSGQCSGSGG